MPRRPRIILPRIPLHIIQRGNNRQPCFIAEEDYHAYLEWLKIYAEKSGCHIHAYVLMTNHVHLLFTPDKVSSAGQMMKALGQRYVQYFNRAYQRSGTLWEGRFRSCLLQDEVYLLCCMRYIELNPVRAGMVNHPGDYPWSSYRVNAQGEQSELIESQDLYIKLAGNELNRQSAYRELFRHTLEPGLVDQIRQSTNGNVVLGNDLFSKEISRLLGKRVTHGKPGRPANVMVNEVELKST